MKKVVVILLILVGIGVLALCARFLLGGSEDTWICENEMWVKHGNPSMSRPLEGCGNEATVEEELIIGGDKDKGGCLIGAGYSWCEVKQKCLRVWEEPCAGD